MKQKLKEWRHVLGVFGGLFAFMALFVYGALSLRPVPVVDLDMDEFKRLQEIQDATFLSGVRIGEVAARMSVEKWSGRPSCEQKAIIMEQARNMFDEGEAFYEVLDSALKNMGGNSD